MKTIPLTQGRVVIVDDADYQWLSQWKWYASKNGNTFYAARYVRKDGKHIMIMMHREILKPPTDRQSDHKDGNGLNNQRYNLRVATCLENAHNRKKQSGLIRPGISKYKGVYRDRHAVKWRARITVKGKRLYLGRFLSEVEAAKTYDSAAQKYFGEFANTNFLKETG